jgi:hypothetical protein
MRALVVTVLGQALMRRAFTDLAVEFSTVDAQAAERAVRVCRGLLARHLAILRDQPIQGALLTEEELATVALSLLEMTDVALEQIGRNGTTRY